MPQTLLAPTPPRRPFPRWALWTAAALAVPTVVAARLDWDVAQSVLFLPLVAAAGAVGLWLEERYDLLLDPRPVLRAALVPVAAVLAFVMAAAVSAALSVIPLGAGAFLASCVMAVAWWFAGALFGGGLIRAIDRVVSALVRRFRTRVAVAVSALLLVVLGAALGVTVFALRLWEKAAQDGDAINVTIDLPGFDGDPARSAAFWREHPSWFVLLIFVVAAIVTLPVVVSACLKLADAVMERLLPLQQAFTLLGQGARDFRVEEKGSADFVTLSRTFNQTVTRLAQTERMERAFGVYVSSQVLDRIRAQHGDAVIPPALRDASVFFADIRGFTSMSERLTPEQVVGLLNRSFARIVPVIEAHEGYLNKFIGDAVVVVFNGPVDMADHPERAARCALAVQEEIAKMNAEGAFPEIGKLEVGVGIATGPMVAGNVGSEKQMEYTVIGDTVNLSARLTSKAGPGEVWVSEATANALPEAMRRTALEPITVKGKQAPLTPWRLDAAG